MRYNPQITPSQDTGWGLIYRVNDLLRDIEVLVIKGDYNNWNFKLDRIWVNLCYREKVIIEKDGSGEIIEIKLSDSDIKEKEFLDKMISKAKRDMRITKKDAGENYLRDSQFKKSKNELYKRLVIKDIWIRKKMFEQKLYIKEIKSNPAGAMWGR